MPCNAFDGFISAHATEKIPHGQSGAEVYRLRGGKIAKLVKKELLTQEGLWERYRRESLFYSHFGPEHLPFVPEVYENRLTEDRLLLVLKEYRPLSRGALSEPTTLQKIPEVLSRIHALPPPDFLPKEEPSPVHYAPETLARCRAGWEAVLAEHPGRFSQAHLENLCRNIGPVNERLFAPFLRFVHGDFHLENLLTDDENRLLVCDWQNCGIGEAGGDLAFFLSRLSADGVSLPQRPLMEHYCRLSGIAEPDLLEAQMRLADLNTAFLFWHQYLHGSAPERVSEIYGKMCSDMDFLTKLC